MMGYRTISRCITKLYNRTPSASCAVVVSPSYWWCEVYQQIHLQVRFLQRTKTHIRCRLHNVVIALRMAALFWSMNPHLTQSQNAWNVAISHLKRRSPQGCRHRRSSVRVVKLSAWLFLTPYAGWHLTSELNSDVCQRSPSHSTRALWVEELFMEFFHENHLSAMLCGFLHIKSNLGSHSVQFNKNEMMMFTLVYCLISLWLSWQ